MGRRKAEFPKGKFILKKSTFITLLLVLASTLVIAQDSIQQSSLRLRFLKEMEAIPSIHNDSTLSELRLKFLTEIDTVIDYIENDYISERRGLSEEEWDRRIDMIYEKIKSCKNIYEYWKAFRYIGLLSQDQHFKIPDEGVYNRERFFKKTDIILPLHVKAWKDGTVYNVRDFNSIIPPLAQIISVNGVSAQEVTLLNRQLYPGEKLSAMSNLNSRLEKDPRYWCNFSNYFYFEGIKSPYEVKYIERGSSEIKTAVLHGKTREYLTKRCEGRAKFVDYLVGYKAVDYTQINDSIGVLGINLFWGRNFFTMLVLNKDYRFPRQLRRAMRRIKRDDIKELIVDVRSNGGGLLDNVGKTVSYFSDSVSVYDCMIRVTNNNRKLIQEHGFISSHAKGKKEKARVYKAIGEMKEGVVFDRDSLLKTEAVRKTKVPKYRYSGNVYLLTSNYTFSAAQKFAQDFQRFNIGDVAGEPCGGYSAITTGNTYRRKVALADWIPIRIPMGIDNYNHIYEYETVDIPISLEFDSWLVGKDKTLDDLINLIKYKH